MKKHKNIEKLVIVVGVVSIALITLSAFVFSRAAQCQTNFTRQQDNISNCTTSANIGFGMILGISAALLVTTIILFIAKKQKRLTHTVKRT